MIVYILNKLVLVSVLFNNCQANKKEATADIKENSKPNIIIICADDLGYRDLVCYGAIGVQTPNINNLAENGIKFRDAFSAGATSTNARYSLLTASYAFRKKKHRF